MPVQTVRIETNSGYRKLTFNLKILKLLAEIADKAILKEAEVRNGFSKLTPDQQEVEKLAMHISLL